MRKTLLNYISIKLYKIDESYAMTLYFELKLQVTVISYKSYL